MAADAPTPLSPEETTRLTDFARACKAAARGVLLYPAGHPSITATLGRIVQLTSAGALPGPMRITVQARELQVDGRAPARPDASITELATMLHDRLIGEITVHAGGGVDAWRTFLLLLGRTPEDIRAEGGIARLWEAAAGRHIELREIDYAQVLRERRGGDPAAWEHIIATCLQGTASLDVDDEATKWLLEIASDETQLGNLLAELESRSAEGQSGGSQAAAVIRLLQGIVNAATKADPERVDGVLRNMASAVGRLSPELILALLSHTNDPTEKAGGVVDAVVTRMTERTIAGFVARNASAEGTSIDRLAEAFHTLVRGDDQQQRLISLAHDEAAASPLGDTEGFEDTWNSVAQKLMTSYSDKPFVSESYARELSASRSQAIAIEEINDDPPERMSAWRGTVATSELRQLDLTLLADLLRIEQDNQRWDSLMPPVVALLEDLLLVGDFDAAIELIALITTNMTPPASKERRQLAMIAIDTLIAGTMMRHLVTHLASIGDVQFERVKAVCSSMGEVLVRPLAEAISTDIGERARDRLTAILIGFGPAGRRQIERLKGSANPAVRRTAIYLLREFGGHEALPDLTELLDDSSPQIQREAVQAILAIGSDRAFEALQHALTSGSVQSRDTLMKWLSAVRADQAAPFFGYILRRVDHTGAHRAIYLRSIEVLGALKDPVGISPLKEALYRGEWWAPRRTSTLRGAAAASLARIGTPDALDVLEEAMASGPRGVRSAVRSPLASTRAQRSVLR
jgi:HEAT repeats/PBS lyase HEAT-like repeat